LQATYRLTAENVLEMDFKGTTDAPTPLALTNHAYWNLAGGLKRKAHDHTLRVAASNVLALGDHQVNK
jgi:aldose 1-epimerase